MFTLTFRVQGGAKQNAQKERTLRDGHALG